MDKTRRDALVLAGGMAAVSFAGALMQPRRLANAATSPDLATLFPTAFGAWQLDRVAAALVRPAGELANTLYQQLLERTYIDSRRRRVMLSVAYGQQQSGGLELHWPEVCYAYGGFTVHSRRPADMHAAGLVLPVTQLIAQLPMRFEPITYWATLGGTRVPDANTFRLLRLNHAVRREVVDGMLVRVSSIDTNPERAFALHAEYVDALLAALTPDLRRRVIGEPRQERGEQRNGSGTA